MRTEPARTRQGAGSFLPAADKQPVVKILYDRPAGELRVLGRWKEKSFAKAFVVEQDFDAVLSQAKAFIQQETGR